MGMKPPPAEKAWMERLPRVPTLAWSQIWPKVWPMKVMYATPRDYIVWLKFKHRNLYVANKDRNIVDQRCLACRASPESQLHLIKCGRIRAQFWNELMDWMEEVGINMERSETFLAFGILNNNKLTSREGLGVIAVAWRCLYAEITQARIDSRQLKLSAALKRTASMLHARVTAYGEKWLKWARSNRKTSNPKEIPKKHQNHVLIKTHPDGTYEINEAIKQLWMDA